MRLKLCLPAALATAALFPAGAFASPAEHATADLFSGPFHVQFDAQRAANAPADSATGSFTGTLTGVGFFAGPVTCLDIEGNRVGLFYPITSSSPSLFSMLGSGVFIYLQFSGAQPQSITFLPVPFARTTSCTPLPGLLPVTSGTASFSG